MAQIRVMGSDLDDVRAVLDRLLSLVRADPGLTAGPPTELGMRGPGRRMVFELLPAATADAAHTVRVERTDTPRRAPQRQLALPAAGDRP
ncbi:hypothetical protein [Streptomyces sp. NPDC001380]|uniref:hypothetical protein n=1 Tax=Streptomyces sp. NPDC001380 TaxID=3364566 RepID=UPI0036CE78A2